MRDIPAGAKLIYYNGLQRFRSRNAGNSTTTASYDQLWNKRWFLRLIIDKKRNGSNIQKHKTHEANTSFLFSFAFNIYRIMQKICKCSPPTTALVTASTFNNDATANSALLNIYNGMSGAFYVSQDLTGWR